MGTPMWPNFFLVGAPKAGTTAIASALARHPDVFPCAVKEPNYFNSDIWLENFFGPLKFDGDRPTQKNSFATIRDEATYLRLYAEAEGYSAVGDCSIHYLRSKVAAAEIHKKIPHAKIIISLRNPVDRAFSHFLMDCKVGKAEPPFGDVIASHIADVNTRGLHYDNYIDCGLYYNQVKTYQELFGAENVLVILFEDLKKDFTGSIWRVWNHIGVVPHHVESVVENRAVVAKASHFNRWLYRAGLRRLIVRYFPRWLKDLCIRFYYRAPETRIDPEDRALLTDVFREDVERLAVLLDRDLSHWIPSAGRPKRHLNAAAEPPVQEPVLAESHAVLGGSAER